MRDGELWKGIVRCMRMRSRVLKSELHKRWLFVNSEVGER